MNSNEKLKLIIFSVNRVSHHHDYALFLKNVFSKVKIINGVKEQIKTIFNFKSIILLLDVDYTHSLYLPLIFLRNFFGGKTITLGVSSERLHKINLKSKKSTLLNFFFLKTTKKFRNIKNLTIHSENDQRIQSFYSDFVMDFQYWDLPYLKIIEKVPKELVKTKKSKPIISILGTFNEKRYRKEIVCFIKSNFDSSKYNFLIAGNIDDSTYYDLKNRKGVYLIKRAVTNAELKYLYGFSDFIFCCYNKINRPSGFFGRALQYNKLVIVLKGSYLDKNNYGYENLVRIESFSDLNMLDFNSIKLNSKENSFSTIGELEKLKNIIYKW